MSEKKILVVNWPAVLLPIIATLLTVIFMNFASPHGEINQVIAVHEQKITTLEKGLERMEGKLDRLLEVMVKP